MEAQACVADRCDRRLAGRMVMCLSSTEAGSPTRRARGDGYWSSQTSLTFLLEPVEFRNPSRRSSSPHTAGRRRD